MWSVAARELVTVTLCAALVLYCGKGAGLPVFREGGKLRCSGGEGNGAKNILLLGRLSGGNGGQGRVYN
jgi:hypothetical protein